MEDVKAVIAKNITDLRLLNNMTQIDLAQKINYSDKTVSKWERGESAPDIAVMVEIANLFGVTLDYLVKSEHTNDRIAEADRNAGKYNRRAISYISESAVWIAVLLAFIITSLITNRASFQWLYFLYAVPVTLIIKLVFNSIWFNPRNNYYIISALMWSVLMAIHVSFLYFGTNVSLIYLLGIAGQIVIILWSFIKRPQKKNKLTKQ